MSVPGWLWRAAFCSRLDTDPGPFAACCMTGDSLSHFFFFLLAPPLRPRFLSIAEHFWLTTIFLFFSLLFSSSSSFPFALWRFLPSISPSAILNGSREVNSRLYLRYSYPPQSLPCCVHTDGGLSGLPGSGATFCEANSDLPTHKLVPIHLPIPTRAHSTPIPFSTREEERAPPKRRRVKQRKRVDTTKQHLASRRLSSGAIRLITTSFDHISQYLCQLDWSSGGWTGAYAVRWPSGW